MTCNSAPDVISGFTIVRNAVTLDYPIVPAIRSILELCDEVVVNVGKSDDDTRDLVAGVGDPRVRIIDTIWDFSRGSAVLAHETNRAMAACRGAWGVYIQADEVLHETGAAAGRAHISLGLGPPVALHAPQARGRAGRLPRAGGPAGRARGAAGGAGLDPAAAAVQRRSPGRRAIVDRAAPRGRGGLGHGA